MADLCGWWLPVLWWRQIVSEACDVGQSHLRRHGQCPDQRHRAVGIAAGALEVAQSTRRIVGQIPDVTDESGDADIGGDVPYPNGDPGLLVFLQQGLAIRVIDRSEIEVPASPGADA